MARLAIQTGAVGAYQLTMLDCARCGEVFAVTYNYDQARRRDGRNFICPNGHENVYGLDPSADELEKLALRRRAEQAEADARRHREAREWAESRAKGANIQAGKAKAKYSRAMERVHAGVCPHCNRTFKQLAAHMKSKHPRTA